MTLLITGLWPGLAAAVLLGLCVGALSGLPRERLAYAAAAMLASVLGVLVVLSLRESVPGEAGLWVESAAAMLAAYLAGCVIGGLGRRIARGG